MYQHYIFTATSYTRHKRAAYDLVLTEEQLDQAQGIGAEIEQRNIHSIPTSLHVKEIDSPSIEALKKTDPYFKNVYFCSSVDEFMKYVEADLELNSVDVAKYILSLLDTSKLKLQKLVCLSYAAYLQKTGKSLFTDKIYTFQYGPVAKDLYDATKKFKDEYLRNLLISDFDDHTFVQMDCRFARAEDGFLKTQVIQEVLNKFGSMSAKELVDFTHRDGSPWSVAYDKTSWKEITDNLILSGNDSLI